MSNENFSNSGKSKKSFWSLEQWFFVQKLGGPGVASITFAVISFFAFWLVFSLIGIIFGITAYKKNQKKLGIIGTTLSVLSFVVNVVNLLFHVIY